MISYRCLTVLVIYLSKFRISPRSSKICRLIFQHMCEISGNLFSCRDTDTHRHILSESITFWANNGDDCELIELLLLLLLLLLTTVEISGFQGPLLPSRLLPLMAPIAYIS